MPNVFGVKLVPLLIATVAFWIVGAAWYGAVFSDAWMAASGVTEADFENSNPAWMTLGVLIAFLSALVIGKVLVWTNAASIGDAIQRVLVLWFGFGVTMALYTLTYTPAHSITLFLIDAGHLLVGWVIAGAILAVMK